MYAPTLAQILRSIGPIRAAAFLDQLYADLTSAQAALSTAADSGDLSGLQRATHCLIALAGTAGAVDLEQAARALNLDAHASGGADLRDGSAVLAAMTLRLTVALDAVRISGQPVERPDE